MQVLAQTTANTSMSDEEEVPSGLPTDVVADAADAAAAVAPEADLEFATGSTFKSVIIQDVTPAQIDKLWDGLGFGTKPDDLLQYNRQHNVLIENTMTALAKNIKNLKDTSKKSADEQKETKTIVSAHTVALEKLKDNKDEETAAMLAELMRQVSTARVDYNSDDVRCGDEALIGSCTSSTSTRWRPTASSATSRGAWPGPQARCCLGGRAKQPA